MSKKYNKIITDRFIMLHPANTESKWMVYKKDGNKVTFFGRSEITGSIATSKEILANIPKPKGA